MITDMLRALAVTGSMFLLATLALSSQGFPQAEKPMGPHQLHPVEETGGEICAFCHTPSNGGGGQPLWMARSKTPEFEGVRFDTATAQASDLAGSSLACLACHDGAQAPDSAVNIPIVRAAEHAPKIRRPGTRDHPVGIPFSGYRPGEESGESEGPRLSSAVIDGQIRWWIDAEEFPNGTRDKTDVVFYSRSDGNVTSPYIECASCHDPHAGRGDMFLRVARRGSNLCLACHGT